MDVNKMFDTALQLAVEHHKGIRDKGGLPYILHPLRIAMQLEDMEEKCAALLHDTKEDKDRNGVKLTDNMFKLHGLNDRIILLVDGMTKSDEVSWKNYIMNIKTHFDPGLKRIKILDLKDNINLCRLPSVGNRDLSRCERYHEALKILGGI